MSFLKNASGLLPKLPTRHDDAMDRIELIDRFVKLAEVASASVLNDLAQMLNEDPKRFLLERDDKLHLINEYNSKGYNSTYVAAKNGNRDVLKFLFQNKAMMKLPSLINGKYS